MVLALVLFGKLKRLFFKASYATFKVNRFFLNSLNLNSLDSKLILNNTLKTIRVKISEGEKRKNNPFFMTKEIEACLLLIEVGNFLIILF